MTRFETAGKMSRERSRRGGAARVGMALAVALAGCGDAGSSTSFEPTQPTEASEIVDVTPASLPVSSLSQEPDTDKREIDQLCLAEPEREGCEVRQLELALDWSCGTCHGSQARREGIGTGDGMFYIDDFAQLASHWTIRSCDGAGSRLVGRIREGSMPPPVPDVGLPVDAATANQLSAFIDGMCDDLTGEGPGSTERHAVEVSLRDSCGSCHGAEAAAAGNIQGELGDIENLRALVDAGQINRCGSEGSPLLFRISDYSMPPRDAPNPRLTEAQIQALADFIDRPCDYPAIE